MFIMCISNKRYKKFSIKILIIMTCSKLKNKQKIGFRYLRVNCTTQNDKPCVDGIHVHSKMNVSSTFSSLGMRRYNSLPCEEKTNKETHECMCHEVWMEQTGGVLHSHKGEPTVVCQCRS